MQHDDKNIRTLDAVTAEAGLVAMEEGTSTPDDRRWARGLVTSMQARIAEMRRNLLPASAPIRKAEPIRPSLAVMTRDALVAMFTGLTNALGGDVQYAHRNLDSLSDNDLRRLIQTIDAQTNEG